MSKQKRQYGLWRSPLSAKALSGAVRLNDVQWDNASGTLVWAEGRGKETVLVAQSGLDAPRDLTDGSLPVRGRVGYGGGEFTVGQGQVYFSAGDRLYSQPLRGGTAQALTPAFGGVASPRLSHDGKWLAYVYTYEGRDGIALVDTAGNLWPVKLFSESDFVMQPVWSADDRQIAFIAWNHPQMPWNGTQLLLAYLDFYETGTTAPAVGAIKLVAGDEQTSIFQPEFSPDGRYLAYVSDASGWSQLYVYDLTTEEHQQLTDATAEHDIPAWVQGLRTYGWTGDGSAIYYLRNERGVVSLHRYDLAQAETQPVRALDGYTALRQIAVNPNDERAAVVATASDTPERILSVGINETTARIHRYSTVESLPSETLSEVEVVEWAGHDGETVHGLYYPPASEQFEGDGRPPLIVEVHGGPTSQRLATYDPKVQFFTTRGYGVLRVNYRGSTGYGLAYQDKLHGAWGVYDVEDCASGAAHLVEQDRVDGNKLVIMGGSAGGFTVLQSLIEKPGFYKAGICMYGVSNQFLLVQETHKFEERYSDTLLGPLPEAADLYHERSPYFQAHRIKDPVAVFQGAEDEVVPQNQSDAIVASLRSRGIPHVYHVYEGEGHGWRKPETIEAFYNAVLDFLTQYVIYA